MSTYVSIDLGSKLLLAKSVSPQSFRRLVPIALSKQFADAVLPGSGIGGDLLLVKRLTRLGVPRGQAAGGAPEQLARRPAPVSVVRERPGRRPPRAHR